MTPDERELLAKQLALKATFTVHVDIKYGLAHIRLPHQDMSYKHTKTDCGSDNVNVDMNEDGKPIAVEDISGDISDLVDKWLLAIQKAGGK